MNLSEKLNKFADYLDEWFGSLPNEAKNEMFANHYIIDTFDDYWESLEFDDKVYYHDKNYEEYAIYTMNVTLNID